MYIRIIFYMLVMTALNMSLYGENISTHNTSNHTEDMILPPIQDKVSSESGIALPTEAAGHSQSVQNEALSPNKSDNSNKDTTDTNVVDILLELPGLLARFCPEANVCVDDKLQNVSGEIKSFDDTSCCTACSCLDNCHTTRNCCFPSSENKSNDTMKSTGCYSTVYPPPRDDGLSKGYIYKSYQMIDAVRIHNNGSGDAGCGDINVAPWGSFFPVFSKSKREVYKNSICATADGVDDVIPFKASVSCFTSHLIFKGDLFTPTVWDSFYKRGKDTCDVLFEFPEDETEEFTNRNRCFQTVVESCPDQFDNYSSIPRDQLIAACHSGLYSPYTGGRYAIYKNVFCSICNDDNHLQICQDFKTDERTDKSLVALLDNIDFENFGEESSLKQIEEACLFLNGYKVEDTCRPVMCPTGQIRAHSGVCRFISTTWYNYEALVYLQLNSEVSFEIDGLDQNSFTSQWTRHWSIQMMHYFPTNASQQVVTDRVVVLVYRKFKSVNPKFVHDMIGRHVNKKWTVKTPNGNLSLRADFMNAEDNYQYVDAVNKTRLVKYLHKSYQRIDLGVVINKMSYCDQVRLHEGEFGINYTYTRINLHDEVTIMYNNFSGRLLIPGEVYLPDMNDPTQISVCVENSGLTRITNSGRRTKVATYTMLLVLANIVKFNPYLFF